MKKFFLLSAAALLSLAANSHTVNNPIGADGRYIVKYNCETGSFAESNDIEVDETFVFAIDVTGSWLADWLKGTATAEGASRGVAINNWTGYGDTNGDFRRLKQITGNIWGTTCNFKQLMTNVEESPKAVMLDSITYVYAQLFGFEYTSDNPGAGWWMWDGNDVATTEAPGSDCLFAFLPYTGTKTSPEFYADDFGAEGFIYSDWSFAGYAAPCVGVATSVDNVEVKSVMKVIEDGQLFLIKDGIRYNVLGAIVRK